MTTDTVVTNPQDVTVTIWPTVWIYSLLIAVCVFTYKVVLYTSGLAGDSFAQGLITDFVIIVLLFSGIKNYKRINNGNMTYGVAVQLGVTISIISTILRSALNTLYLTYVGSSILTAMKEETLNTVQSSPVINQYMDLVYKVFDFIFTTGGIFVMECFSGVILGIIISLLLAAILKTTLPFPA